MDEFTKLMQRMKAREEAVGNLVSKEVHLIDFEEQSEDQKRGNKPIGDDFKARIEVEITAHWIGPQDVLN